MKKKFTLVGQNGKTVTIDSSDYQGILTHHHIGFDGVETFVELILTTGNRPQKKSEGVGRNRFADCGKLTSSKAKPYRIDWVIVPIKENLEAARELLDAQCREYNDQRR